MNTKSSAPRLLLYPQIRQILRPVGILTAVMLSLMVAAGCLQNAYAFDLKALLGLTDDVQVKEQPNVALTESTEVSAHPPAPTQPSFECYRKLTLPGPAGQSFEFCAVTVQGGRGQSFVMGREGDYRNPPVMALVDGPFETQGEHYYYLGRTEVTLNQYRAVTSHTPAKADRRHGDLPVSALSFTRIEAFIEALNEYLYAHHLELLPKSGTQPAFVRLPSEEEWEFAARGGNAVNAEDFARSRGVPAGAPLRDYEWFQGPSSSRGKMQSVALLKPNALGLHDMLGNVAEMTSSQYRLLHQARLGGHVSRGGHFLSPEHELSPTLRTEEPEYVGDATAGMHSNERGTLGFRLALALPVFSSREDVQRARESLAQTKTPSLPDNGTIELATSLKAAAPAAPHFKIAAATVSPDSQDGTANSTPAQAMTEVAIPPQPPQPPAVTPKSTSDPQQDLLSACRNGQLGACHELGVLYLKRDEEELVKQGLSLLNQTCTLKESRSCLALGLAYLEGAAVRSDLDRAETLLRRACALDEGAGCSNLGLIYTGSHGGRLDKAQALALLQRACKLNDPAGCSRLGELYYEGVGTERNYGKARELFQYSCNRGYAQGCTNLGSYFYNGSGQHPDLELAAEGYRRGCELEDAKGCDYLGELYAQGKYQDPQFKEEPPQQTFRIPFKQAIPGQTAQDKALAQAEYYYERSCVLGLGSGCSDLAEFYLDHNYRNGLSKIAYLLDKACSLHDGAGCAGLGYLHEHGKVVALDYSQAEHYYRQGCALNHALACHNLGVIHESGRGVKADLKEALNLYDRSCELNLKEGCRASGRALLRFSGLNYEKRSAASYQKGCDLGDAQSCHELSEACVQGKGVRQSFSRARTLRKRACDLGLTQDCPA